MAHFETNWKARDGLILFAQSWDVQDPVGAVCLVHGLGEHSGRYTHLADFLNRSGYSMLAFDLRGHGKSGGPRGHAGSFEYFMDDIERLLSEAAVRYPEKPLFLYGHSLGGLLVLNYLLRRKPELPGAVVTGPGLRTALEQQTLKIAIAKIGGRILPKVSLPTGLDPNLISRDVNVVQAYRQDPLVHDQATLGMARETLASIPVVFERAGELQLPLLLMHGTADQLAFVSGSKEFAALAGSYCTLRLWEGLYHEIHNEPEQGQVFTVLLEWLNRQLSR